MGSDGVSGWEQALRPFQSCVKKTGPHRAATWRNSFFLSLFWPTQMCLSISSAESRGHLGVQVARSPLSPGDCGTVSPAEIPALKPVLPVQNLLSELRLSIPHFPAPASHRAVPHPPRVPPRSASFCGKLVEIEGAQTAHLGDPNLI